MSINPSMVRFLQKQMEEMPIRDIVCFNPSMVRCNEVNLLRLSVPFVLMAMYQSLKGKVLKLLFIMILHQTYRNPVMFSHQVRHHTEIADIQHLRKAQIFHDML